jgi:hypothetical protein
MREYPKVQIAVESSCSVVVGNSGKTFKLFDTTGAALESLLIAADGTVTVPAHSDITGGRYAICDADVIIGFGPVEVVRVSVEQAEPDQAAAIAALTARIAALENA